MGVVGSDSGHGDAGHFVFCEANADIPADTNGPDPIFPGSHEAVRSLCVDTREKTVGSKIFVRPRMLLIQEWLHW